MFELVVPGAPPTSDLVALLEVALGLLLLAGALLVRRGHVRWHRYVQTGVILGNVPPVLLWMVPQYWTYVLPGVPGSLGQPFFLVPTLMLFAGLAAELLGVYIILVAGTNLLPERFRFRRYKLWMRTELLLWWSVVVLGLGTYFVWYAGA